MEDKIEKLSFHQVDLTYTFHFTEEYIHEFYTWPQERISKKYTPETEFQKYRNAVLELRELKN